MGVGLHRRSNTSIALRNEDGGPLLHATARNQIIKACRRADLRRIGWHVLRHTFASWLVSDGVPLPVVQSLLGHANIEMTMR